MNGRIRRRSAPTTVAATLLVAVASVGCGIFVKKIDTDALEAAVGTLPGVTAVRVTFDEDGFDSTVTLTADVPDATPAQIEQIAGTVNRDDDAAIERVRLVVTTDGTSRVESTADVFDGPQLGDDADRVRRFGTSVAVDRVTWSRTAGAAWSQLSVDHQQSAPVAAVLDAIRTTFDGGVGDIRAYLRSIETESSGVPRWQVAFPFSVEQQQRVESQLAALRLAPLSVTVGPEGFLSALTVRSEDPSIAHQQLMEVISTVGAGPDQPLMLSWRFPDTKTTAPDSGAVDVGACDYPDTHFEEHPEDYLTPAELDLQQRMRDQFDTC